MGLFNFFRKRDPNQERLERLLKSHPEMFFKMFEFSFHDAVAKAINLNTVGRKDDAKDEFRKFYQAFNQKCPAECATENNLVKIGFHITYVCLPELINEHWNDFLYYWKSPFPFSLYLVIKALPVTKIRLTTEQLAAFSFFNGKFDDFNNYYAIKFPDPWQMPSLSVDLSLSGVCFFLLIHNTKSDLKYMFSLKKSLNNQNEFRIIHNQVSSSYVNSFDYDPSINTFIKNCWTLHLKYENRRKSD